MSTNDAFEKENSARVDSSTLQPQAAISSSMVLHVALPQKAYVTSLHLNLSASSQLRMVSKTSWYSFLLTLPSLLLLLLLLLRKLLDDGCNGVAVVVCLNSTMARSKSAADTSEPINASIR